MTFRRLVPAVVLALFAACGTAQTASRTFHNPLLPSGPDPWVIADGGFFYYMNTTGSNLTIRRTRNLADLASAEKNVVWTPPATGPYSKQLWAPELHHIAGRWYIYFAADGDGNEGHRIYVVENAAADPMQGTWTFKGKVADATDKWAIDATVFEENGQNYMVWSGWEGNADGEQRLYIAHLQNPWTIDSPRTEISRSTHPWERVGDLPDRADAPHVNVNEGPEILQHDGRTFLTYSASGCWTDFYELGLLEQVPGSDPLRADAWRKLDQPVFRGSSAAGVYGPGHNSFFHAADGQDWLVYHANSQPHEGCGPHRSPRMQPFTWKADGTPDFGAPVSGATELQRPATP